MKNSFKQRAKLFFHHHRNGIIGSLIFAGFVLTVGAMIIRRSHDEEDISQSELEEPEKLDISEKELPLTATDNSDKTAYEKTADLLATLWKIDDLLLEEDHATALKQAEDLRGELMEPADIIFDILNRAHDHVLEQDDLFLVQGLVEDLTRYLAGKEQKEDDFAERFPWLN